MDDLRLDDPRRLPPIPDKPDEQAIAGWAYWPAPTVGSLVLDLCGRHDEMAPLAGRLIVPRFAGKPIKVKGHEVWTKIKKVSPLDACNIGFDAEWFLLVNFALWKGMPGLREPAIHEALCRMGHDGSELPADFAGFVANARRWPTWKAEWARAREAWGQGEMFDGLLPRGATSVTITAGEGDDPPTAH